ncbi:hypothetical protein CAPTEDRAFT_195153 [Capitella teleta]|uniref:Uncharacterized protein n=1 Tax=Capitella teleta TaxID=283909 RepID=R7VK00_CAPTE|nr:hypothetical protein CAPTEDRAFT_195153 [Capitella teleta]|eukprot:ELU16921.1 hypothetical protein CAPTEDRAFT_195153 [Capitella teleta]
MEKERRVYNFDNDSKVPSPNLFSPARDWNSQTYSKGSKIALRKTPPKILHLTTSSQAGILKAFHKSTNNKTGRVSFGETDRYFFTPQNSSSESVNKDARVSDVYDFVADTRQNAEYDSDEDRMQQLDVLHQNIQGRKSETADDEWEMIKKSPKKGKIAELSSQSPSSKVIQWMNHDLDPYDLDNEDPSLPATPREQELLTALNETSFLPKSPNTEVTEDNSPPLSSDLVEMFQDLPPEAMTPGRRLLASSQTETESNFHSLFDDDVIF